MISISFGRKVGVDSKNPFYRLLSETIESRIVHSTYNKRRHELITYIDGVFNFESLPEPDVRYFLAKSAAICERYAALLTMASSILAASSSIE